MISGCKGLKAQRSTVESGRNIYYILLVSFFHSVRKSNP